MKDPFSKERALYLVDNPTKIGFSWWFFFAGIVAAYGMHRFYGDSQFVIMILEKYVFLTFALMFGFLRIWISRGVTAGRISLDSALLYLIPLFGYFFTFFGMIGIAHMAFAISAR